MSDRALEFDDVDDLEDLGNLEQELVAADDDDDLGRVKRRVKRARVKVLGRRLRKLATRTGGVNPAEVRALFPSPRTLYARRFTAAGAIPENREYFFFHKGVEDSVAEYGFAGSDPMTERHTNIRRDGRLPQDEVFTCHGVSFEFPDNIPIADLRLMSRMNVRWEEKNGSVSIQLGTIAEMPRVYGIDYDYERGGATSGVAEGNPRLIGPKYVHKTPIFVLRGALTRVDQGKLVVKSFSTETLSADLEYTVRLHGIWYQHKSGHR